MLDLGIDLASPYGEMVATVVSAMAQLERRLIGERTRTALAIKRSQGVRLGRPREVSEETVEKIQYLYESGVSVAAIARKLNEESIPSPRGGRRYSPGVKRAPGWANAV